MTTLLGQLLLLVLCVTLVVAVEYEEFGCKFDDRQYNYRDDRDEFGDNVKSMEFDDTNQFKLFMNDLEKVRTVIRYKFLYNTMDPFFQMHEDYKADKSRKPVGYKFADFFAKYKPNPYMNKQRFNRSIIFSVIDIYWMMNRSFGNKYPTFKDSFVLATCDEDIKTVVLDNVPSGIDQKRTPRGFVHDRIVGVIPFLIENNVRGFVIVESIHLTARETLVPIIMTEKYLNHTLSKNEVKLFGPNVARYNWVPGTSESYIRIDHVEYDTNVNRWVTRTEDLVGEERVTQTDLLFMTPRSLCSFVKHVWKNNLLDTSVRLLQDAIVNGTPTRYYLSFDVDPLHKRTREVNGNSEDHSRMAKYMHHPEEITSQLKSIPFEEVFENQALHDALKNFATASNIEYSHLFDMLQEFYDICQDDTEFINEFKSYKPPEVDTATFWSAVTVTGNVRSRELNLLRWLLRGKKSK